MESQQSTGVASPRLTSDDIERAIRSEFYFTAADGVLGESEMGTKPADWTCWSWTTMHGWSA
ncbi:hypothetical protein [Stenotrophomonas sp. MMGLT7]|uniref:hypothetical protein n=1 Tax=Stenotrophomonas sp. MMGLT7 TaxID=2901227 RepID=UPI001E58DEEB|nr:hypothetical protein [Stenotrophomonas sp. MMGLT7]MCD7099101.1 hypothetical protein [Stenotrophomonas sp. MMGLT7]